VRVEHVGEGERPGMVALVPAREGGRPAVQVLRPTRDDPRTLVARFELEEEDFVVALEPGAGVGWRSTASCPRLWHAASRAPEDGIY